MRPALAVLAALLAACTTPPPASQIATEPARRPVLTMGTPFDVPAIVIDTGRKGLPPDVRDCVDVRATANPDQRMAACSAAIGARRHSDEIMSSFYETRSMLLLDRGDLPQALADAETALRLDRRSSLAWFQRATVRHRLNDDSGALADYNEALTRRPDFGSARLLRSAIHARAGRYDLALADADLAIRFTPTAPNPYVMRAFVLHRMNRLPAAIADLDQAAAIAPHRADIRNQRGLAHAASGNRRQALADYTEAARLDPSRPAYAENRRLLESGFVRPPP